MEWTASGTLEKILLYYNLRYWITKVLKSAQQNGVLNSPRPNRKPKYKNCFEGNDINFIVFTLGTVQPESGRGNEHMNSFDYAYKLEAVRGLVIKTK